MQALGSETAGGADMLLSASADGSVAGWWAAVGGIGAAGAGRCSATCHPASQAMCGQWHSLLPCMRARVGLPAAKLAGAPQNSTFAPNMLPCPQSQACNTPRPACAACACVPAVWAPSHATFKGADREMSAKLVIKAHESAVLGMTLFSSYSEGSQGPSFKLATTGEGAGGAAWYWGDTARGNGGEGVFEVFYFRQGSG